MRQVETSPSPTAQQVSDQLPSGAPMLAVLAKRTYDVDPSGKCSPAEDQAPLFAGPLDDPDVPALLAIDTDLHPYKPRTTLPSTATSTGEPAPAASRSPSASAGLSIGSP